MDVPTTRILTPARIVALAVIAVLVSGLTYLRVAPDGRSVSVPAGAKAGDLVLDPCDYATENGSYQADCGTLVVAEDRTDPQSRLIALPVTRIRARSADPREPVFRLEGGPGLTNMQFRNASRLADDRDVVLVGYRGVDGSVRLECPEVSSALRHSSDVLSEKSFAAYADAFRECANRLTGEGVDLTAYGLVQQVDDMEAARVALGYGRIDLLSESAGTRTAQIYSWRYPESIHRSVMIGANPPGNFLWDASTTDEQIARYAELCAKDESCRERTDDLGASLRRTAADMPDRWLFLPIDEGAVRLFSFFGLMESSAAAAPLSGPITLDSWLSAAEGDASGFWFQSLSAKVLEFPFVWGQYAAAGRVDARAASERFSSGVPELGTNLGDAATAFMWGGGRLVDAWPAAPDEDEYGQVRTSNVETLLIGGELDFTTPPQVATKQLLPHLPNGHEVVLPGFGHTVSFWAEQPEAGTRLINTFLASGRIDDSLYTPQIVDLSPGSRLTTWAKVVAGTMIGFALLMVLSLLWMARRVHTRRRFGPRTSAVLRSLSPVVLGLGGWFLGVVIALATMPGVPVSDELLVALSVGLPIGLGIYLAWVHRDWAPTIRTMGFAAAAGGALLGGWFGSGTIEGPVALVATIVGAAVGANLLLLALDMSWDHQGRDRRVGDRGDKDTALDPDQRTEHAGAGVA